MRITGQLDAGTIRRIKRDVDRGEATQREIARRYGVDERTVRRIKHGQFTLPSHGEKAPRLMREALAAAAMVLEPIGLDLRDADLARYHAVVRRGGGEPIYHSPASRMARRTEV